MRESHSGIDRLLTLFTHPRPAAPLRLLFTHMVGVYTFDGPASPSPTPSPSPMSDVALAAKELIVLVLHGLRGGQEGRTYHWKCACPKSRWMIHCSLVMPGNRDALANTRGSKHEMKSSRKLYTKRGITIVDENMSCSSCKGHHARRPCTLFVAASVDCFGKGH